MNYSVKQSKAALVEWFALLGESRDDEIVAAIEHDRQDYALQPGLVRKLLVLATDPVRQTATAGGMYFFSDVDAATRFLDWASNTHRDVSGLTFEERDFVGERHAHVCAVLGHLEADRSSTVPALVHLERFVLDSETARAGLESFFERGRLPAGAPDLLSLTWLYDPVAKVYFLLSVAARAAGRDDAALPDLRQAAGFAAGGQHFPAPARIDDMRFWVYTIWEPRRAGMPVVEAVWPNSPPLPAPAYWQRR